MFYKFRVIVSIDGSGHLGIVPLKIIDYLHQNLTLCDSKLDITSWIDLFSSTSASSIFTGALMLKDEFGRTKYKTKDLLDFYCKRGHQLLTISEIDNIKENPMNFVLNNFFAGVKISEIKNHFLFVCKNKNNSELFSFTNSLEKYKNLSLSKVMKACIASDVLGNSFKINNLELVDSKKDFQNPALMAYEYARFFYSQDPIILISIGTGEYDDQKNTKSQAQIVDDELKARRIFDDKLIYFRYQPTLHAELKNETINKKANQLIFKSVDDYISKNQHQFSELLEFLKEKVN